MPPPNPPYPPIPPSCHRPKSSYQQLTSASQPPFSASGRHPPVVFLLQPAPAIPEWRRLLACRAGNQHVEVHVPTGPDLQQGRAVGQAPMDHGEQYLVTLGFQFEAYVATTLPGDGELSGRIELDDLALHPVLVAKTWWSLSGRGG